MIARLRSILKLPIISKEIVRLGYQMAPVLRKRTITSVVSSSKTVKKAKDNRRTKQPITGRDGLPIVAFPSPNDLEKWLAKNHKSTKGIWVKIAKKASGIPTVTYEQMLDVALCFGWIDGTRSGFDDTWFIQRISPRRPKSNWSQVNREKVKRLIRIGKMQPSGQRLIDEAKADGRWDNASEPASGCVMPDELLAEMETASPLAQKLFRNLSKPSKLTIISRIQESNDNGAEYIKEIVKTMEYFRMLLK